MTPLCLGGCAAYLSFFDLRMLRQKSTVAMRTDAKPPQAQPKAQRPRCASRPSDLKASRALTKTTLISR